jgi:hypothetical protein
MGFSEIQPQDYEETFAWVVRFDLLCLLLPMITANSSAPLQLDVTATFPYVQLKETI